LFLSVVRLFIVVHFEGDKMADNTREQPEDNPKGDDNGEQPEDNPMGDDYGEQPVDDQQVRGQRKSERSTAGVPPQKFEGTAWKGVKSKTKKAKKVVPAVDPETLSEKAPSSKRTSDTKSHASLASQ
jgi:hypothetical protein